MRRRDDTILLKDMLDYARRAATAVEGASREALGTDAVLAGALERFLEVIGEAASRLEESTRESAPDIPWREIIAMRNRLVHGYFAVDPDILWTVVKEDLPALIEALERMVAAETNLSE
jgi:uncharacterized protein with HEPN domain